MRLNGKKALITGGNSGIGFATAKLFVAEGAEVAITGRNQNSLDAAQQQLGPDALVMKVDLTDLSAMERAISKIVEKFGKLDVIFANAGIGPLTPIGSTSLDLFEEVLKVNVTSTFLSGTGVLAVSQSRLVHHSEQLRTECKRPTGAFRIRGEQGCLASYGTGHGIGAFSTRNPGECDLSRHNQNAHLGCCPLNRKGGSASRSGKEYSAWPHG
jgi:NAD(P)-dependent dehydrogenase (short-subunit alcohol dehydrogenase family)